MANKEVSEMALYDVVEPSGMTVGEIITSFRQAKDRRLQLQKLADLTCANVDFVKELLLTHGVKPVEMPRARRKKEPPENFRGGVDEAPPIPAQNPETEQPDGVPKDPLEDPVLDAIRALVRRRDALASELARLDARLQTLRLALGVKGGPHDES
ncbi:MAG: hypothetical protein J5633_04685 [Oscillospiraceae bacterium]|nr:hypothetical protein [Oscillospiraceae bacterium]